MGSPSARATFYGWWKVGAALLVQGFSVGLTQYAFPLFLKPVAEEFGASRSSVASGYSGLAVAMALLGPLLGHALDRRSIRAILCLGAGLMAGGFALIAAAPQLWLVGLLFAGVVGPGAMAAGPMSASKLVANWFLRCRGLALGISSTGTSIGGFLLPKIGRTEARLSPGRGLGNRLPLADFTASYAISPYLCVGRQTGGA